MTKPRGEDGRLQNETYLDCWDGPLAGGEPAAGRFQARNLDLQGLESLCVTRRKNRETSLMFKSDANIRAATSHFFSTFLSSTSRQIILSNSQ